MVLKKVYKTKPLTSPIPLHAACGLLENEGIFIVGGRREGTSWVTDH